MKSRELRIGNLIYWDIPQKKGVVHLVNAILPNTLHTIPISLGKHTKNEYKPIPLSEEWLLKFGYIHCSIRENHFIVKGHTIWLCDDLFICDRNGNILKHVHQLQNLYFALTGEELEITKTK
jgi:hypothetical protein